MRQRTVGPPMRDSLGALGHRLDESQLLLVHAHPEARAIIWPHLAVPALEKLRHVRDRAVALVVLHEDLTRESHHRVHVAGRRDRAGEMRHDTYLVGIA